MLLKWDQVVARPEYQALPDNQKAAAADQYFNDVVAPHVPANDLPVAANQFSQFSGFNIVGHKHEQPGIVDTIKSEIPRIGKAALAGAGEAYADVGKFIGLNKLANTITGQNVDPSAFFKQIEKNNQPKTTAGRVLAGAGSILGESPLFIPGAVAGGGAAAGISALAKLGPKAAAVLESILGSSGSFAGESAVRGKSGEDIAKSAVTGAAVGVAGPVAGSVTRLLPKGIQHIVKTPAELTGQAVSLAGSEAALNGKPITPGSAGETLGTLAALALAGKAGAKLFTRNTPDKQAVPTDIQSLSDAIAKTAPSARITASANVHGEVKNAQAEHQARIDNNNAALADTEARMRNNIAKVDQAVARGDKVPEAVLSAAETLKGELKSSPNDPGGKPPPPAGVGVLKNVKPEHARRGVSNSSDFLTRIKQNGGLKLSDMRDITGESKVKHSGAVGLFRKNGKGIDSHIEQFGSDFGININNLPRADIVDGGTQHFKDMVRAAIHGKKIESIDEHTNQDPAKIQLEQEANKHGLNISSMSFDKAVAAVNNAQDVADFGHDWKTKAITEADDKKYSDWLAARAREKDAFAVVTNEDGSKLTQSVKGEIASFEDLAKIDKGVTDYERRRNEGLRNANANSKEDGSQSAGTASENRTPEKQSVRLPQAGENKDGLNLSPQESKADKKKKSSNPEATLFDTGKPVIEPDTIKAVKDQQGIEPGSLLDKTGRESAQKQTSIPDTEKKDHTTQSGDISSLSRKPGFRTIKTTGLPDNLAEATTHTSLAFLKGKDGTPRRQKYEEAKRKGNDRFARQVIDASVKPGVFADIKRKLNPNKPIYIVPVQQTEGERLNRLPMAYAMRLAQKVGGKIVRNIVRVEGKHNTDATEADRLMNRIRFDGNIPDKNGQYVIADDNYTSGNTTMALVQHLMSKGIDPEYIHVTSISASRRGKGIIPRAGQIEGMLRDSGLTREALSSIIGHDVGGFTDAEINIIRDQIRKSTRSTGSESLRRIFAGGSKEVVRGDGPDGQGRGSSASGVRRLSTPPYRPLAELARFNAHGLPVKHVQAFADTITSKWKNGPRINVVNEPEDVPFSVPLDTEGVFHNGEVWLISKNLETGRRMQEVLLHEVFGHVAPREFLGPVWHSFLDNAYAGNKDAIDSLANELNHGGNCKTLIKIA